MIFFSTSPLRSLDRWSWSPLPRKSGQARLGLASRSELKLAHEPQAFFPALTATHMTWIIVPNLSNCLSLLVLDLAIHPNISSTNDFYAISSMYKLLTNTSINFSQEIWHVRVSFGVCLVLISSMSFLEGLFCRVFLVAFGFGILLPTLMFFLP